MIDLVDDSGDSNAPKDKKAEKATLDSRRLELLIGENQIAVDSLNTLKSINANKQKHAEITRIIGGLTNGIINYDERHPDPNAFMIDENDIFRYAFSVSQMADYFVSVNPTHLLVPLRGALPPVSMMLTYLDMNSIRYDSEIIPMPVSEFVDKCQEIKKSVIESALEDCIRKSLKPRFFTLDTSISGTSMKHYVDLLKSYLPELSGKFGNIEIEYDLMKIKKDPKEFSRKSIKASKASSRNITLNHGVSYVPNLMSEDIPVLLGVDYPIYMNRKIKTREHGENVIADRRFAFLKIIVSKKPIIIRSGSQERVYEVSENQITADLFVDIVVSHIEEAKYLAKNSQLKLDYGI
jgi:hypothetical protein